MNPLAHLLVVIEAESEAHAALQKAEFFAREAGSRLTLLMTDYNTYLERGYFFEEPQLAELREERRVEQLQELENMAAPLREAGIEVDVRYGWGTPAWEIILEVVDALGPDMLIAPVHFHPRLEHLFMRSQDWALIRECPVPVFLASERPWSDARRVLVAADPVHEHDKPQMLDLRLVEVGKSLDTQLFGDLHVAHLFDPDGVPPRFREAMRELHEEEFDRLADRIDVPVEQLHYREVPVETGLLALCEELGVDVLVMGAVKRSRLASMVVGNTAERVLNLVSCDVLVVKPDPRG